MKINSFSRLFAAVKFRDYVESLPHLYEVAFALCPKLGQEVKGVN